MGKKFSASYKSEAATPCFGKDRFAKRKRKYYIEQIYSNKLYQILLHGWKLNQIIDLKKEKRCNYEGCSKWSVLSQRLIRDWQTEIEYINVRRNIGSEIWVYNRWEQAGPKSFQVWKADET